MCLRAQLGNMFGNKKLNMDSHHARIADAIRVGRNYEQTRLIY